MTSITNCQRLLLELQNEITKLEVENSTLKERLKNMEPQKITISKSEFKCTDWIELESGKRFLTKNDLGKYLGIAAGTISNQLSKGVFPIRPKKVGRHVRFDMREVLEYLDTNKPFWERDQILKLRR